MLTLRKSSMRGRSKISWLDSFHTFSFSNYYDRDFMGFGHLRVINEDTVQPNAGFSKHPHRDMEIISYVVDGALEHEDSMDNGSIIAPGEIQVMSAGTGVLHSEFNHSQTTPLHFLQIWIIPKTSGLKPRYQQEKIPPLKNTFLLLGSQQDNAIITIQQDVNLYAAYLDKNYNLEYILQPDRMGWLQLVKGDIMLNQQLLSAGDGVAIQQETNLAITALTDAEFLLFDLQQSA